MTPRRCRKLVMVSQLRHESEHRMQQAYRQLWQWATALPEMDERKETRHASSGLIRAGFDPASEAGSND